MRFQLGVAFPDGGGDGGYDSSSRERERKREEQRVGEPLTKWSGDAERRLTVAPAHVD